ncbi:MAG: hypothetical protein Q9P90_04750 [candidate division KSB1 bacterium]|nr:hypothetical protein [candidate division KSB1 bacterium]
MNWLKFSMFDLVDLFFLGVFVLVFILFILDFRLASRRSWAILLGMAGLGGVLLVKRWLRKQVLRELEAQEKIRKRQEKELEALRQKAEISEAAYRAALAELQQARKEHALFLARLDRELQERLLEIEKEYQNLTPDETLEKLKAILSN